MSRKASRSLSAATTGDELPQSALGFTVKSGWASATLVTDSGGLPAVVDGRRIALNDPAIPESRQPYHAGFGTARDAGVERTRLVASVERFGMQSVVGLIDQWRGRGYRLHGAGIVVGSLIDPDQLSNPHIRIHAQEGRLFRRVVEDGAAQSGVRCSVWRERDVYSRAVGILHRSEQDIRAVLLALGRTVGGPWRAEEKAAVLAAWLVLASGATVSSRRTDCS
jgi:hypothetical protein